MLPDLDDRNDYITLSFSNLCHNYVVIYFFLKSLKFFQRFTQDLET